MTQMYKAKAKMVAQKAIFCLAINDDLKKLFEKENFTIKYLKYLLEYKLYD